MENFPWESLSEVPLVAVLVWLLYESNKAVRALREVIAQQSTAIGLLKQMSVLNNAKLEQILTEILRGGHSSQGEKT